MFAPVNKIEASMWGRGQKKEKKTEPRKFEDLIGFMNGAASPQAGRWEGGQAGRGKEGRAGRVV